MQKMMVDQITLIWAAYQMVSKKSENKKVYMKHTWKASD